MKFWCNAGHTNEIVTFEIHNPENSRKEIHDEFLKWLDNNEDCGYEIHTDYLIKEIIKRKKQGLDCTEAESAEIKGYLRELKLVGEQSIVAEIQELFPIEYGEFLEESDKLD